MTNKIERFKKLTDQLCEIYKKKNQDYGDSFSKTFKDFGLISAVTRIADKINRYDQLTENERQVEDETIKDTLMDMAGYCIMTVMEMDKPFTKILDIKNGRVVVDRIGHFKKAYSGMDNSFNLDFSYFVIEFDFEKAFPISLCSTSRVPINADSITIAFNDKRKKCTVALSLNGVTVDQIEVGLKQHVEIFAKI